MLVLILAFLATWRASRLVATDFLFENFRAWVQRRGELVGYLVNCPWCVSMYVGAAFVIPAVIWPHSEVLVAAYGIFTASGVAGMLATLEDHWDRT